MEGSKGFALLKMARSVYFAWWLTMLKSFILEGSEDSAEVEVCKGKDVNLALQSATVSGRGTFTKILLTPALEAGKRHCNTLLFFCLLS
jgi:hypothetical protein